MATYTVAISKHETLAVNVVDIVNILGVFASVRITNRSPFGTIYTRTDGIDPTVEGDDTFSVIRESEKLMSVPDITNIQVRLIAANPTRYSVEGV